jgi:hypothetical protein
MYYSHVEKSTNWGIFKMLHQLEKQKIIDSNQEKKSGSTATFNHVFNTSIGISLPPF